MARPNDEAPERRAREKIDAALTRAGWVVQAGTSWTSGPAPAWPFASSRPTPAPATTSSSSAATRRASWRPSGKACCCPVSSPRLGTTRASSPPVSRRLSARCRSCTRARASRPLHEPAGPHPAEPVHLRRPPAGHPPEALRGRLRDRQGPPRGAFRADVPGSPAPGATLEHRRRLPDAEAERDGTSGSSTRAAKTTCSRRAASSPSTFPRRFAPPCLAPPELSALSPVGALSTRPGA